MSFIAGTVQPLGPRARKILLVVLVILPTIPLLSPPSYFVQILFAFFLWAALATSWNIVGGLSGYISVGNSFFFGVGAYLVAMAFKFYGISPFLTIPLAGLIAAIFGLGIGLITLRIKGPAFIITTIAVAIIGYVIVLNGGEITGGGHGLVLPILDLPPQLYYYPFYYVSFVLMIITLLAFIKIRSSGFGLALLAIREDEGRAEAMGLNTLRYKSAAFAVSAFFTGIAGAIYAFYQAYVFPDGYFTLLVDLKMITMTLLGGIGTILGPLIGSAIIISLTEFFTTVLGSSELNGVMLGALIIAIVKFKPDGILGRSPVRLPMFIQRMRMRAPA